ncbi:MAG TPA: SRPBCC family protein [Gaiellaceae bacterium]|nr:SRPBCC family protein [Gaiellaceae bacterium]
MTGNTRAGDRILGSLRSTGGTGVVRIEDRFAANAGTVWSVLTEPGRLAGWLGDVEGDLRLGGEFRAHFFASGWKGTGRIEACEPGRRLLVQTTQAGKSDEQAIEVTLTREGDGTVLVWEERGMPAELVAAYGAGVQVHVEDLGAHLDGRERCDADARFGELFPAYQELPVDAGHG